MVLIEHAHYLWMFVTLRLSGIILITSQEYIGNEYIMSELQRKKDKKMKQFTRFNTTNENSISKGAKKKSTKL